MEYFAALAKKFDKPNPLNEVFEARAKSIDKKDHLTLLKVYLEVFSPSRVEKAEQYLNQNEV